MRGMWGCTWKWNDKEGLGEAGCVVTRGWGDLWSLWQEVIACLNNSEGWQGPEAHYSGMVGTVPGPRHIEGRLAEGPDMRKQGGEGTCR